METMMTAYEMEGQWAVVCSRCGVLSLVAEDAVERFCVRHMGTHDLVAA